MAGTVNTASLKPRQLHMQLGLDRLDVGSTQAWPKLSISKPRPKEPESDPYCKFPNQVQFRSSQDDLDTQILQLDMLFKRV